VSADRAKDDKPWALFRYRNADGTSKDWAYRRLADGGLEICWGRTGAVSQRQTYSAGDAGAILQRAQQKQRKGYVPLGDAVLRHGLMELLPKPTRTPEPLTPPRPKPPVPAADLSQIASEQDDFWF
jgi:predicted DNA-binding WGR domain protein